MTDQANAIGVVEIVIETRARDLVDGFKVRRALPSRQRRMVGPFIFVDQMGPEVLREGKGLGVAPLFTRSGRDRIHTLARIRPSSGSVSIIRLVELVCAKSHLSAVLKTRMILKLHSIHPASPPDVRRGYASPLSFH